MAHLFLPMFTLGIDYGTNSVRALVVRCSDGQEFGSCVVPYPSGHQGVLLDAKDHNVARQHPADYLFGLEKSVKGALAQAKKRKGFAAAQVAGLGVDTTGSSPIPVDARNVPLAALAQVARRISRRSAGSGKTTPAGAKPRRSPRSPRSTVRSSSPSAATPIPPSGGGPKSGAASASTRRSSTPPIRGSSSPTGCRPSSPA